MDSDIIASVVVFTFSWFPRAEEYPDSVKAAAGADNYKDGRGNQGQDFFEKPDKRAKTDEQKPHNKKPFRIAFWNLVERIWIQFKKHFFPFPDKRKRAGFWGLPFDFC